MGRKILQVFFLYIFLVALFLLDKTVLFLEGVGSGWGGGRWEGWSGAVFFFVKGGRRIRKEYQHLSASFSALAQLLLSSSQQRKLN